jgi:hypothetical protein
MPDRFALVCAVTAVTALAAGGCYRSHQRVIVSWEVDAGNTPFAPDGGLPPSPLVCGTPVVQVELPRRDECSRFSIQIPDSNGYTCETVASSVPEGQLARLRLLPGERVHLRYRAVRYLSDAAGPCDGRRCAFIGEIVETLCGCGRFTSAAVTDARQEFGPFDETSQPIVLLGRGVEYEGEVCFTD